MVGNIGIGIANAIGFKSKGGGGNISYPGLIAAWSAKGKSNDDEDRAILKDLTGNGHDISLKGFAFNGMSGYGGYKKNFTLETTEYQYCELVNKQTIQIYKRTFAGIKGNRFDTLNQSDGIRTIKLKVSGITEENKKNNTRICIVSINEDNDNWETFDNGIFEANYKTTYTKGSVPVSIQCQGNSDNNINITVEILPEYPDALVFDGVNDYGINEDMPKVNDYTLIIKRNILGGGGIVSAFGKCDPATSISSYFWFEYLGNKYSSSFAAYSTVDINAIPIISFQTKKSYNGITTINAKETIDIGDNCRFYINSLYNYKTPVNIAFYSAYLFNRSLTEQEIKSFIRKHIDPEYLLPSEIEAINNSLVAKTEEVS